MGTASSRVQLLSHSVSKALGIGEAAAAIHVQEVSRVVFKVGQWQGILLVEVTLGLCFQERTLVIREGHGEKGIRVTDKFIDVSLPCHLRENTHLLRPRWNRARGEEGNPGKDDEVFVRHQVLKGPGTKGGLSVADCPNHSDLF